MPELAGWIEVHRDGKDFFFTIDGVEFPWRILSGVRVNIDDDMMPGIVISIPAKHVSVSDKV